MKNKVANQFNAELYLAYTDLLTYIRAKKTTPDTKFYKLYKANAISLAEDSLLDPRYDILYESLEDKDRIAFYILLSPDSLSSGHCKYVAKSKTPSKKFKAKVLVCKDGTIIINGFLRDQKDNLKENCMVIIDRII